MFFTVATEQNRTARKNINEYTARKNRMSALLHTYNDGSRLMLGTVYELMKIPNWDGNRIMDTDHARKLGGDIEKLENLDRGYCVIVITEKDGAGKEITQRYTIDGQHRLDVLKKARDAAFYEAKDFQDFPVTYTEKDVDGDSEATEYFNQINNMKPMEQRMKEPKLLVGDFIGALEHDFDSLKKKSDKCFRQLKTTRPYIHNQLVREMLEANIERVRRIKPTDFAKRVWDWNRSKIDEFKDERIKRRERELAGEDMTTTKAVEEKNRKKERCIAVDFALAYDDELPWILACLP